MAPALLPSLTAKEAIVWAACCASDKRWPCCYVEVSLLQEAIQAAGMQPDALAGLISSMVRKNYLFAFGAKAMDVELTCDAARAHGLADKPGCNGRQCSCGGKG